MIPKLTVEQTKRFRQWLVEYKFCSSMFQASKLTDSPLKCHKTFLKFIDDAEDSALEDIEDIMILYVLDDNCVHDKDISEQNLPQCVHNKDSIQNEPESVCVHDNAMNEQNTTNRVYKKRGKQKKPVMQHYPVRLPVESLERLKALEGTTSGHIRKAIELYLNGFALKLPKKTEK